MTQEKYKEAIETLRKEHEKKKYEINKQFAFSNSSVKIGDIVTDHMSSIKVDTINLYVSSSDYLPRCVYSGITLKKDGTETKRKERKNVYQENLK